MAKYPVRGRNNVPVVETKVETKIETKVDSLKKQLKIAVYAISKNEEKFVERFCASAKDADLILIADTGSTDKTVELARSLGVTVYEISVLPWRFDKAKDTALNLVPADVDVCISLDLDEVMEPGWREEIERVWQEDTTRLRYKYDWGRDVSFFYEKIHHRTGYHWHHPVHEYPRPDSRTVEMYAFTDMLLVSHHPDNDKPRTQYMSLLELGIAEDPFCPRNAFHYVRELGFYNQWEKAVEFITKYLAMPGATQVNERSYVMRLLGKAFENLNRPEEAYKWYRLAVAEAPATREPWCDLANFAYTKSNWPECYAAAQSGIAIKHKVLEFTMDPTAWGERLYDLASIAAWNLGLKDSAIDFCKKALEFKPTDDRLLANLRSMIAETVR